VFRNILIIKPSSLGDVVHALPVLAKLKGAYPDARISWLVGAAAAPILASNAKIDRLIYFRRRSEGLGRGVKAQVSLLRRLAAGRFDCVVDLQGLLRSALWAFSTRARRRVGLDDAREGARFFYTDVVRLDGRMHAVDRYLRVGNVLGFDAEEPEFEISVPGAVRRSVDAVIEKYPRPFFALSLGARWPSKNWPAANFADAARRLLERFGGTVFLVGARQSLADAKEIEENVPSGVVNLAGRTNLEELVALVAKADLFVTPDTGSMHVADALGTPLVAVFGPTDPARTGPYFQRERVVTAAPPCREAPCLRRECSDMACMRNITGEAVFLKAAAVLEGAA